jgi:hypothetical protein
MDCLARRYHGSRRRKQNAPLARNATTDTGRDAKAMPASSFAVRLDEITRLVGAVQGVLLELVSSPGKSDPLREHNPRRTASVHPLRMRQLLHSRRI